MATGPKVATSPLEVLSPDTYREPPFLTTIWGPFIGGVLGFTSVLLTNWATKRPVFSGIQRIALITGGSAMLGKYIDSVRTDYFAERDAVFRHYIELHPDDFPPYKRQKYAEVFEPWIPIR